MENLNMGQISEKDLYEMIHAMTIREKIGQLQMIEIHRLMEEPWDENMAEEDWNYIKKDLNPKALERVLIEYGVGFIFYGGTGILKDNTIEGWRNVCDELKKYTDKTRLKIPVLQGLDAIHGFNYLSNATIYPHNLGVVSTWDDSLAYRLAKNVEKELRYAGMNFVFAPNGDIARDPRWSRVYESCGEDPYLAAKMTEQYVKGYQESKLFGACAKHFLAYGESSTGRDREPIDISERTIREIHLPSFRAAVQAGVKMIMLNSSSLNGIPVHKNKWIMQKLLREELGFQGLIVSDWADLQKIYTRHMTMDSLKSGIIAAINAGIDLNMVPDNLDIIDIIINAVENGLIPMKRINESVERVLRLKAEFNLFNGRKESEVVEIGSPESVETAYHIVSESAVLLKNDQVLPISDNHKRILVVGEAADTRRHLCGGWTMGWNIINEEDIQSGDTLLTALRKNSKEFSKIDYAKDEIELSKYKETADMAIMVIAEEPYAEEGCDLPELCVPQEQLDLLKKLRKNQEKVVCVLISGRPLVIANILELADAIVWCCLPGTQGGTGIADILLGKVNPSGKLPISFPRSSSDLPVLYNSRNMTTYNPLFPFGYGLSYTSFTYENIYVPEELEANQDLIITLDIRNNGDLDGKEVVQVWGRHLYFSYVGLRLELLGYKKLLVRKGQVENVTIVIEKDRLKVLNEENKYVFEEHLLQVLVGGKQFDIRLHK